MGEEPPQDPKSKDKYGATWALKKQILKKYEFIEVLGKGSYGCVSKGKCRDTGRIVALKVMENQTNTEYDTIKLLREIQLMRRLQNLSMSLMLEEESIKNDHQSSLFTPELIDIICLDSTPEMQRKSSLITPDTLSSESALGKGE